MDINQIAPPALPTPRPDYTHNAEGEFRNVLRLFFSRFASAFNALISPSDTGGGGAGLYFPYGSFSSTQTQSVATINTPTLVTLNVTDGANGTYLQAGNGIHVKSAGVYDVQFSCQITNADVQIHEAAIWLRKNGADLAWTNSVVSVQSTHGGLPGYDVVAANFFVELAAGDYIEFWWASNSTQVTLNALPAITTPFTAPGSPSVVITLTFVSRA